MSAQSDTLITIRVNKNLKESADSLFDRLALNMSIALDMFLRKAVSEDAIPFPVNVKNIGFGHGLTADDVTCAFNDAVSNDITANQQKGLPIAGYDPGKKQAYLEYVDGVREYVNG